MTNAETRHFTMPQTALPWQARAGRSRMVDFWKTVVIVIGRNGRLGKFMAGEVDLRAARRFRWVVILHVMLWPTLLGLYVTVAGAVRALDRGMDLSAALTLTGASLGEPMLVLLLAIFTGSAAWFFCPRRWDRDKQDRAIALSYYTCAPLAFVSWLILPMGLGLNYAVVVKHELDEALPLVGKIAGWGIAIICLWWLQLTICAGISVTRRRAGGIIFTAIALPAVWAAIAIFLCCVIPACIAMLVLMLASLQ